MPEVTQVETGAQEVTTIQPTLAQTLEAPDTETDVTTGGTEVVEGDGTAVVEDATKKVEEQVVQAVEEGATKEEINELRSMLRTLRNDNISLQARLATAERVQKGDFGTDGKGVEPTELEVYKAQYDELATRDFSQLLAVMEVNPKYEDVNEVCSNSNFGDIFEAVAKFRSEQNGTNVNVELLKAQVEVWSMPNPYKYMYDLIKQYHPNYAVKTPEVPAEPTPTPVKATPTPVKAPGSVAGMGGGTTEGVNGWTAERIDSMPEDKLHTVPRDIYNKWLSGELN